jgi:hypothetical protein
MPLSAGVALMVVAVIAGAVFDSGQSALGPTLIALPGAFLSGFAYNNRLRQLGRTEGGWWFIRVRTFDPSNTAGPPP